MNYSQVSSFEDNWHSRQTKARQNYCSKNASRIIPFASYKNISHTIIDLANNITAHSVSTSKSPGLSPCFSRQHRTNLFSTTDAQTSHDSRKLYHLSLTSATSDRRPFLRVHIMRRVCPPLQLLVLLV